MTFELLGERLLRFVNSRIQSGQFTERGLARVLGISQPHMHNVLKGARTLRPELADRVIVKLEVDLLDLFEDAEISGHVANRRRDWTDAAWENYPKLRRGALADLATKPPERATAREGLGESPLSSLLFGNVRG